MKKKPVASLFVGRWQPFHEGHKALIETVLKKRKPVVIAIRDTEMSDTDPYTLEERWTRIQSALHSYGSLVKIVVIPDIDEICYGRDVGYDIRKIELDKKIHLISGTQKRKENPPHHPIVWLTGQSGAGKTRLANTLRHETGGLVLDGDEMRESISRGAGFSRSERHRHNLRVAKLAITLSKQSPVFVSVIAPYRKTREEINALIKPLWVYVHRKGQHAGRNYPYEIPRKPHVSIDTNNSDLKKTVRVIKKLMRDRNTPGLKNAYV